MKCLMAQFLLYLFSATLLHTALCQHFEPYIKTRDGKFLCHGERYTTFPPIPDQTELLECPFQIFSEFPPGTFRNKAHLSTIDVSVGRLETLSSDTFKGAKSLQSFNASRCNLLGDIPSETFCDHTPDMRSIDLSHNRNYVFTSASFECLEHLTELRINDTVQNCDADTVQWIEGLPPGTVIGNECDPLPQLAPTSGRTIQYCFLFFCIISLNLISAILYFNFIEWHLLKRSGFSGFFLFGMFGGFISLHSI